MRIVTGGTGMAATWYEIRIRGIVDPAWAEWFDGMGISHQGQNETVLAGWVPDQAALHGCLAKLRNLNLHLLSVNPTESPADSGDQAQQKERDT